MSQIENSKRSSLRAVHFRDLEIRILNLFRISKFELRISKGKLDHFVNVATKKTYDVAGVTNQPRGERVKVARITGDQGSVERMIIADQLTAMREDEVI